MPSETLTPDTPAAWFNRKFPKLAEKYGEPIHEQAAKEKGGKISVRDTNEDFLAACLGAEGTPDAPTVYLPAENRFLAYSPSEGVFIEIREADLEAKISQWFLECARVCREGADASPLEFRFRDSRNLSGIIKKAKSIISVPPSYFSEKSTEFIVVKNGVLRLSDRVLLSFDPKYRKRNKIPIEYIPGAPGPVFLDVLM
ncbi:MAG TPA: hypothetical protein VHB20_08675, partial [Verrucomicrobiae bacterium]|nr:hypothetical protein [Verrucomicrobiae bacterium]